MYLILVNSLKNKLNISVFRINTRELSCRSVTGVYLIKGTIRPEGTGGTLQKHSLRFSNCCV